MNSEPVTIVDTNLSHAWTRALTSATKLGISELVPLVVSINLTDGLPVEDALVRSELDLLVARANEKRIEENANKPKAQRKTLFRSPHTTANTIFPASYWVPSKGRDAFYARYIRNIHRIHRCPGNKYGVYFERCIQFKSTDKLVEPKNQLEHIITTYLDITHRSSAMQISIVDPFRDLTTQSLRGFPCLQQVNFLPNENSRELHVVGTYSTQYIVDRAYGNYLGLCGLGKFVADALGLTLTKMICITPKAKIGDMISKKDARLFLEGLVPQLPSRLASSITSQLSRS